MDVVTFYKQSVLHEHTDAQKGSEKSALLRWKNIHELVVKA